MRLAGGVDGVLPGLRAAARPGLPSLPCSEVARTPASEAARGRVPCPRGSSEDKVTEGPALY